MKWLNNMHVHIIIEKEVVEVRGNFGDGLLPVMPIEAVLLTALLELLIVILGYLIVN